MLAMKRPSPVGNGAYFAGASVWKDATAVASSSKLSKTGRGSIASRT